MPEVESVEDVLPPSVTAAGRVIVWFTAVGLSTIDPKFNPLKVALVVIGFVLYGGASRLVEYE